MKHVVLSLLFCSVLGAQGLLIRQPSLNHNGTVIAFSWQGDIWTVPAEGGKAQRLTVHDAYESNPRFSPDGSTIAFSGTRYGNTDIFTIPAEGGEARRVTWHSANDNVVSWSGKSILFTTAREFVHVERDPEMFTVTPGGTESRLLDVLGSDPVVSPDGKYIAFTRGGSNPVHRQAYNLAANKEIWLWNTKTKKCLPLSLSAYNDYSPQWGGNSTLYYLSSANGCYNIFSVTLNDAGKPSAPQQLTFFTDYAVRNLSISGDGSLLAFEQGLHVYTLTPGGKPREVPVTIAADQRFDQVENKTLSKDATEYAVSPNGKLIAFAVRGEVFIKEADKEKSRSVNISSHPYRDVNPVWLSDTTLAFCSDRNDDNYDVYIARSADKAQPNLFKTLKREILRLTDSNEDEEQLTVSPDGKKLALVKGRGTLLVYDITADGSLGSAVTLLEGWAPPKGLTFSPDSKWLAYSREDLTFNEDVFIHAADNSLPPVNVSMHPRSDENPAWSPDGSKLAFISARNNRNNDVWFVWLKKEDWEKTKQDWDDKEPVKKDDAKDTKKDSAKTKPVKIDFENIHERLVQVTSFPGDEGNPVLSKDGETFFYTGSSSTAKGYDLYSIKWDGKDLKELTKGGSNPSGVSPDKDAAWLYFFKQGGVLNRYDTKADKTEALPYAAKIKIDNALERIQMFAEGWRAINSGFYDPGFHGNNWQALREQYEPLCSAASTDIDFRDMFNYMLGELNASHMGMYGQEKAETQKDATGMLGADLTPVGGGMKVLRVVPGTPADRTVSKLTAGDVITAVDGQPAAEGNFYALLQNRADELVLLSVTDAAGKDREVAIRPTASLRTQLYREWVLQRRALADKYSAGRIGYLHIQGMDMVSFENFERELTAAGYGKDALVIDVRFNGGGFTTDYLMTVLNYKQHAYTIPRGAAGNLEKEKLNFRDYYPTGERLVFAAWTKPSAALCNEASYSNAEIFSHAYKTLGIGTLIGMPTNGSVISTGAKGLVDGSYVRLPFRGWFTKATDKNQELGPAVPDILIDNLPESKANGEDQQLKTAVDTLLQSLNRR